MASAVWDAFLLIDPLLPTGGFAHSLGLEPTLLSGALADDGDVARRRARGVPEARAGLD